MAQWWIDPGGDVYGPTPDAQQISYEDHGYKGPYPTRAAAQAALSGHAPGTPPGGPKDWWVVGAAVPHAALRWTELQSKAKPPGDFVYGPYTKAQADAKLAKVKSPITPPTVIRNPLDSIKAALAALGQPRTWLRVGEVIAGVALLIIGLAQMTGRGPQTIVQLAKTAAKVVPA